MGYVLMLFSSSTTANRLKRLAFRSNLREVSMIQTPKLISQNGCTYSLRCPVSTISELRQLADEYGLKYSKVYRELVGPNGIKSYELY